METIIERTYKKAKKLKSCNLFTGKENFDELIHLFLSPQGIEFCQKNGFPDMELMNEYKCLEVQKYGIYINAEKIKLSNVERICLVGNTDAELYFDDPTKRHVIILMHGAKASIKAVDYSVVFVYAMDDCKIVREVKNNASIM